MRLLIKRMATWLLAFGFATIVWAEKIVIKGSNTFGEELAPRLIQEFNKIHPDTTIDLESKGTGTGFAALLAGECDIAAASRPANEDELRLGLSRGIRIETHMIGFYGVAVIVNEKNSIKEMSDAQVRSAFTGIINRWKALGWDTDQLIQTYIRDAISGSHLGFQELAMDRMPYTRTAKPFKSYQKIADAVRTDPHGIGYVSMIVGRQTPGVRAIAVNKIPLTIQSVNEGTYAYARGLRLCTNPNRISDSTKDFIRFCRSEEGQKLIEEMGNVRLVEPTSGGPPSGGL